MESIVAAMTKLHGMHNEIPARILEELGGQHFLSKWNVTFASGEQRDHVMGTSDGFEYTSRVGLNFYKADLGGRDYLNILISEDGDYRLEFMSRKLSVKRDIFVRAKSLVDVPNLIAEYIFS
jgi:hypothetical protein